MDLWSSHAMTSADRLDARIEEYWDWIGGALFLLLTVDLLTTIYAAYVVGLSAEANPLVRWLLARGGVGLIVGNLVAALLIVLLFWGLMELLRQTPDELQGPFMLAIELWLGGLLVAGLFVFANNLSVIFLGQSLL